MALATIIQNEFDQILANWMRDQGREGVRRTDVVSARESEAQSRELLQALARALRDTRSDDTFDFSNPGWDPVREALEHISQTRTESGVSPTEMAWFIASIKQSIFTILSQRNADDPKLLIDQVWMVTKIVDQMALHAISAYVDQREAIIERQQSEMTEVSAPVVKIWDRIVTVPLLGTVDSFRAQTVMENLLQAIVEREAEVAIIDITGVSTVDTMVAQHLLKTAAAVRLMGAECVISGISPKIAQTIVHLGVDLPNVVTRGDLQSGLSYAFERLGVKIGG
ncbi:STAS domain-containing protein [Mangrovibrevibacter kandeliae]|uniref:STAS domain-containing protein n=1 Tax=Mangrovibrevibacter kandeliae TaxID=2968473 RepID=UPI0021174787|nr:MULTISPECIES: STAS domain-containing protein [unclassified Aurantimonas]MCQ8781495.1 STAS domain-containing protein [Aurantimonas sp. CSK15Z-1]MCW4114272.1 STAS domain-containing protein [Aurantimonas sp. MSK8Z-1]